ncbi:hypothetical protein DPMN_024322 [Dreissena polymorpha]|uniref:Uncharacterized protein n=1 Tax=Dreissena polymorpha TaxID=45954 RepID=A0A9D4LP51_DREPO|nr:hypothetical protein DPMN_024322 [Dreissena polymorpha]
MIITTSAINIRRQKYTRKIKDEDSNNSIQCHSWSKKEYPFRACYREQEPVGGKARAIDDRCKQAEKVAGDCGSHKRVWGGVEDSRLM